MEQKDEEKEKKRFKHGKKETGEGVNGEGVELGPVIYVKAFWGRK